MAAPVFGSQNRLVGALSVSGPRYRIEALGEQRIVPVLFQHAQALTKMFGGDPSAPEFAGWQTRSRSSRTNVTRGAKRAAPRRSAAAVR